MYRIEIRDGSKSAYLQRSSLRSKGFFWNGKCWVKENVSAKEAKSLENWCLFHGLHSKTIGGESSRSGTYRAAFFRDNPPMFGEKYACAYCGKRLSKKDVQVDHIISVELAKRRADVREKIREMGWESVNDPDNLCASCARCNRLKSWHGGIWITLGRLGKKKSWQYVLSALRIALPVLCAGFIAFGLSVLSF